MQSPYQPTVKQLLALDPANSFGKTPEQRMAMFEDLMLATEAILGSLTAEQRQHQLEIADQLDPMPKPWWKNLRPDAIAEYQSSIASGTLALHESLVEPASKDPSN